MRVLEWPLRIDGDGNVAAVEQWSEDYAAQVARHIVSTSVGERELAPAFGVIGILDPDGVTESEVIAAIDTSEPDLEVLDVSVAGPAGDHRQAVTVSVRWRDDDDLGDY